MCGCLSWSINKTECWRIDAFELWCWRRLLRVPWTAGRSNQSILKEIGTGCSLEGLMLKLKLQYFVHLIQRADSFEKTLMLGKIESRRRGRLQSMRWLNYITDSMDMSLGGFQELVKDRGSGVLWFMRSQRDTTERLNWTELNKFTRVNEKCNDHWIQFLRRNFDIIYSAILSLILFLIHQFHPTF